MKTYFVYILSSKTGTLYIGVTSDLERRVLEHKNKIIPGFTSKYNINRLVYFSEFSSPEEAINGEKKLKKWNRQKKINLIRQFNPEMRDLGLNLEISPFGRDDKKGDR